MIGVVYNPHMGTPWGSYGAQAKALDQELALAVHERKPTEEIEAIMKRNWPLSLWPPAHHLDVCWLEEGTLFCVIHESGIEKVLLQEHMVKATKG